MLTIGELMALLLDATDDVAKWLVLTHSRDVAFPPDHHTLANHVRCSVIYLLYRLIYVCLQKNAVLLLPPLVVDQSHYTWSSIIPAINSYVVPPFFFVHSYSLKLCVPISIVE